MLMQVLMVAKEISPSFMFQRNGAFPKALGWEQPRALSHSSLRHADTSGKPTRPRCPHGAALSVVGGNMPPEVALMQSLGKRTAKLITAHRIIME